jgi:hypothetical protein
MQVDFYGYTGDCTVSGRLEITGRRLSEMLESAEDLAITDATLRGFRGEPAARLSQLTLGREDLFAVEASDPARDGSSRRIHTVRHLVRLVCGRYTIVGELHALPGAPPLRAMLHRRSVVPLTNCTVSFERAGEVEVRRAQVVIVNGWRIDGAETVSLDEAGLRRAAAGPAAAGPAGAGPAVHGNASDGDDAGDDTR